MDKDSFAIKRRRQAGAEKVLLTVMCTLALAHFTASRARASFVGDLVFCDTGGNTAASTKEDTGGLAGAGGTGPNASANSTGK